MLQQEKFIYSIMISKVNFQLADLQHSIILTKKLWKYMTNHWQYFFDVIVKPDIFINFKRCRSQLTPFSIKHINLKRKTQKFKLITSKEHAEELKKQRGSKINALENSAVDVVAVGSEADSPRIQNTDVEEMIRDPIAAQVTLQYAVNMYHDQSRRSQDK